MDFGAGFLHFKIIVTMKSSDILIIGAGPGGYTTALHAAKKGLSVTIIEEGHAGGTCLNSGCIPTKALCRAAEIIDTIHKASTFGISTNGVSMDFAKVMERKDAVVSQLRNGVETLMKSPGITYVKGHAAFIDKQTVEVTRISAPNDKAATEKYQADNIIIATGAQPSQPHIKGVTLPGVVTSMELLSAKTVPRQLCIIGAGSIGMEMASAFNAFGSQVYVMEYLKEAMPTMDSDIAKRLRQALARRGIVFNMQSEVKSIEKTGPDDNWSSTLRVSFRQKGTDKHVDADMVLIATGRTPRVDGMRLERTGVAYDNKGIHTDSHFRTSVPGIYAIGDVNGLCMLAHAATAQGLHVINQITGTADNIRFNVMPSAVFTIPEAASVGDSEDLCKKENKQYACRKGFYRTNGKAATMGETDGMVKLIATPDGRISGCHALGAHASDIVQEVTALINNNATTANLVDIIHAHPTLSETLHDLCL